jgi:hypothetical protein
VQALYRLMTAIEVRICGHRGLTHLPFAHWHPAIALLTIKLSL